MHSKSIRAFIGSKNYTVSRAFYHALGFEEIKLGHTMSYFKIDDKLGFYLQNAYVKDWVDNTMLFWEVADIEKCYQSLAEKNLPEKFENVRLSGIKDEAWGREFFLHDPSGVLWHIGVFY
jgi:hypothetical protein